MKLLAKQRLLSWRTISVSAEDDYGKLGNDLIAKGRMQYIHKATNIPNFRIGFHDKAGSIYLFPIIHGLCVGYCEFRRVYIDIDDLSHVVRPHVGINPEFRNHGIATELYCLALIRGLTLTTDAHTVDASKVWERVAHKMNLQIKYWDPRKEEFVDSKASHTLKILTKEEL